MIIAIIIHIFVVVKSEERNKHTGKKAKIGKGKAR